MDWTKVEPNHLVWIRGEKGKFYFRAVERDGRLRIAGGNHKMRTRSADPANVVLRTTYTRPEGV